MMNPYSEKEIYLLGSGYSVAELTDQEIKCINQAEVRMALNKFVVFYELSGIIPNYVYFVDFHNKHAKEFLQRVIDKVGSTKLKEDMTLVLNKKVNGRLYPSKNIQYHLQALNPFNYIHFKRPRLILDYKIDVDFVKLNPDFLAISDWSDSMNEPLFHFRSSLTSALNYITLNFDPCKIFLVGVDLNKPGYFYQKEIEQLQDNKNSRFSNEEKKAGKHFTAMNYKGTSLLDNFHIIISNLTERGFELYSTNKDSLLVQQDLCPYHPIIS